MRKSRSIRDIPIREREKLLKIQTPINDLALERSLLSALLVKPEVINDALSVGLSAEAFMGYRERSVFQAMVDLHDTGMPVDLTLVISELVSSGVQMDGPVDAFVCGLVDLKPFAFLAPVYAKKLMQVYQHRKQEADAMEALMLLRDGQYDRAALLFQRAAEMAGPDVILPSKQAQAEELINALKEEAITGVIGIGSGMPELDSAIGGFVRGRLYPIVGRTGEGKTALTMQFAEHAAGLGRAVHVFSKEMPRVDVNRRRVGMLSNVSLKPGAMFGMSDFEANIVYETARSLADIPLTVDDRPLDLTQTCAEIRRLKGRLDVVIVDHARLMEVKGADTEYEAVTRVSGALKRIAVECNVVVMLCCQVNREGAKEKVPTINHIQSTGAIGQDADGVIIIHRKYYNDPKNPDKSSRLIVPKNRFGDPTIIDVIWDGAHTKFVELGSSDVTRTR